ncbi:MAG: hypothetical protein B6I31_00870 [Desulfobacteraceae bacterium 4572_19]|nr:MAG: hypothetical protein B6I31_00870 [Desulfobacteraceae bacterium 4572_19]
MRPYLPHVRLTIDYLDYPLDLSGHYYDDAIYWLLEIYENEFQEFKKIRSLQTDEQWEWTKMVYGASSFFEVKEHRRIGRILKKALSKKKPKLFQKWYIQKIVKNNKKLDTLPDVVVLK